MKLPTDMLGRAGEHFVAAELNRRGVYASPWAGNLPGIDIVAMDGAKEKTAYIQVKAKTGGDWQGSYIRYGWDLSKVKKTPHAGEYECFSLYGKCQKHASVKLGSDDAPPLDGTDGHYWVFVDMGDSKVAYWVVPDVIVRQMMRDKTNDFLEKSRQRYPDNEGHRPRAHYAQHSVFAEDDLRAYKGKWSKIGLKGLEDDT